MCFLGARCDWAKATRVCRSSRGAFHAGALKQPPSARASHRVQSVPESAGSSDSGQGDLLNLVTRVSENNAPQRHGSTVEAFVAGPCGSSRCLASLSPSALATQKLELRFRTPTRLAPTLNP
ncbi:hypothetical protein IG631_00005 [Alternaria alternata]|nr:hypothetical protein IG631_00005 [Alternaria alternata]